MGSTQIDFFGICHVKVWFIVVLKMYLTPPIGRFVWTIWFVQCEGSIPDIFSESDIFIGSEPCYLFLGDREVCRFITKNIHGIFGNSHTFHCIKSLRFSKNLEVFMWPHPYPLPEICILAEIFCNFRHSKKYQIWFPQ